MSPVRMRRIAPVLALVLLALPASARAASVAVEHGTLVVRSVPGENSDLRIEPALTGLAVTDAAGPGALTARAPCTLDPIAGGVSCPADQVRRVQVDAGDGDDTVRVDAALPTFVSGGSGNDTLTLTDPAAGGAPRGGLLTGGPGDDVVAGAGGRDRLSGGPGADAIQGNAGNDQLVGGPGADTLDGGEGNDALAAQGSGTDSVVCGLGAHDGATVDPADTVDGTCERVDYGRSGPVGPVHIVTGGGRFVPIPGQGEALIDRRLIPDILYFVRRYHVHVAGGYSLSSIHAAHGEHPLGLAADIVPGPGGTWDDVDRLAHWAEPRQNHPRWPFRWVGYNGDYNHGRGNHLHLSWMHSVGRPGHPVRTVWLFAVTRGATAAAASAAVPPTRYVRPERGD